MRGILIRTVVAFLTLGSAIVAATAQQAPEQHPAHHPGEMNKKFADPKLDVGQFVRHFENESREVFAQREAIVRAVDLRPGDVVADVGAGTGLFTRLFASQVAPKGTVYAVDISPAFLRYIAERAKRDGRDQAIKTVRNSPDSIELPPRSVDVVFVCDTCHHFENPGAMLASMHRALRPGGRLILVDFDLRKDSSASVKQRARAPRDVYFREIVASGFTQVTTPNAPVLKEEFYAEFRRVEPDRKDGRRELRPASPSTAP
jgi:ubiquinone/menaquinone biosynthesis C-methylase UbiE